MYFKIIIFIFIKKCFIPGRNSGFAKSITTLEVEEKQIPSMFDVLFLISILT